MSSTGTWAALPCLLLCLASITRPTPAAATEDDDNDDGTQVDTRRCRLAKGRMGSVDVARQPETCGSGGCGTRTTTTLNDSDGRRLLTMTHDEGDFDPSPIDVAVRCHAGVIQLASAGEGGTVALSLRFDSRTGHLRLSGASPEADGWKHLPLTGDEAERREGMGQVLDVVLAGGEGDSPNRDATWVLNQIDGVDHALRDGIWALIARDKIEAGLWTTAEEILDAIIEKDRKDGPPAPAVSRRVIEVRGLLARRRRETMPVRVAERRRIGTTLGPQVLPLDPGQAATMFWRKDELCVIQEDDPPKAMRCYAPEAKRWGAQVPIERPVDDGRGLKSVEIEGRWIDRCVGSNQVTVVLPKDVPEDKINVCEGYSGVLLDRLLGVVDGGKMLAFDGKDSFTIDHGPAVDAHVDAKKATELVRLSAGSLLVGEGCCVVDRDGRLYRRPSDPTQRSWDLRGHPPKGETWVGAPPLGSPDQHWAVVQSATPGRVTLWLIRTEPTPSPVPPASAPAPPRK